MHVPASMRAPMIAALMLVLPAGCAIPPDVAPFAEATDALHLVVTSVGHEIAGDVQSEERDRFREAWGHRTAATQAMADYAAGLVSVVEAGRAGRDSATKVVGGVKTLVSTVSDSYPAGSGTVDLITDGIVAVYGTFADDRAARTVADAIEYVSPAVRELASILAADLATMEQLVADQRRGELIALDARFAAEGDMRALNSLKQKRADTRDKAVAEVDPTARAALLEELDVIDALHERETAQTWYVEWTETRAAVNARHDRRRNAIRTAAATTVTWGRAHEQLAMAARTGRSPSFAVLIQLTDELLEAYAEARRDD